MLTNRVEPITISYSFPAKFVVDEIGRPSLSAMRQSIVNTMNNNGMSGKQLVSFSYDINQFTYYDVILDACEKALKLELHNKYRSQLQIRRLLRY